MRSKAQKRAMKYGQQIRTIRGCVAQLLNVIKDLELDWTPASSGVLKDMQRKLEAMAKRKYETDVNKL